VESGTRTKFHCIPSEKQIGGGGGIIGFFFFSVSRFDALTAVNSQV
jgi:hypothetical protein